MNSPSLQHLFRAAATRLLAAAQTEGAPLGEADARLEAELLLAHALGKARQYLYTWPERVPDPAQAACFERLLQARLQGRPIAYLLGRQGFWTLDLEVTPAVLIPRPETELLVELCLTLLPVSAASVADLGTGSGAIALALAAERPAWQVLASDHSPEALAVAAANARRLGLELRFRLGDWTAALGTETFDALVSNPPYIEAGDAHLTRGDLRFEPRSALAAGPDGLDDLRRIIGAAPAHLNAGGWLLLEHGWRQGAALRALLLDRGFHEVASHRDLAGHERVSLGRWGRVPNQERC